MKHDERIRLILSPVHILTELADEAAKRRSVTLNLWAEKPTVENMDAYESARCYSDGVRSAMVAVSDAAVLEIRAVAKAIKVKS